MPTYEEHVRRNMAKWPPLFEWVAGVMNLMEMQTLIHCESGYKALLQPQGSLTYWRRSPAVPTIYVECGGPL